MSFNKTVSPIEMMPIPVHEGDELLAGEFYEDCAYHPCLCIRTAMGMVEGISLVDGSFPRQCGIPQCGVRRLTLEEAIQWRLFGPPDIPPVIEMTEKEKYWLKDKNRIGDLWPLRTDSHKEG